MSHHTWLPLDFENISPRTLYSSVIQHFLWSTSSSVFRALETHSKFFPVHDLYLWYLFPYFPRSSTVFSNQKQTLSKLVVFLALSVTKAGWIHLLLRAYFYKLDRSFPCRRSLYCVTGVNSACALWWKREKEGRREDHVSLQWWATWKLDTRLCSDALNLCNRWWGKKPSTSTTEILLVWLWWGALTSTVLFTCPLGLT